MELYPNYLRHDCIYASHPEWTGWNSLATDAEIAGYFSDLFEINLISPPASILEIGCGMGNLIIPLAKQGYIVTGVDISTVAISRARVRASIEAPEARFICADITQLSDFLTIGSYDIILDGLCMHCIIGKDRIFALKRCRDALNEQGLFFVVTMCGEPKSPHLKAFFDRITRCILDSERKTPERYIGTPNDIFDELKSVGFEVIYSNIVIGKEGTDDQDLLICAARRT